MANGAPNTISDNEARKNLSQDIARARDMEAMMNTEGWKQYCLLLNGQIEQRTASLFTPTPVGGRDAEQHNKGTVYGLLYARDLPVTIVKSMKDLRNHLSQDEEAA